MEDPEPEKVLQDRNLVGPGGCGQTGHALCGEGTGQVRCYPGTDSSGKVNRITQGKRELANQVIGQLLVEAAKRVGTGEWGCDPK